MRKKHAELVKKMSQDPGFLHDLVNRLGAAKMHAQLAKRDERLSATMAKNLERILANILEVEAMLGAPGAKNRGSDDSALQTMESSPFAQSLFSPRSVLLIDDSSDLRSLFRHILDAKGFRVLLAKNGAEALAVLSGSALPQLVLVDYRLGEQTGSDVLDLIERRMPEVFYLSKIVLFSGSGYQISDPRVHAIEPKILDIDGIIQLVRKYCVPPSASEEAHL